MKNEPACILAFLASVAVTTQGALAADEALIAEARKEGGITWYTTRIVTQFAHEPHHHLRRAAIPLDG